MACGKWLLGYAPGSARSGAASGGAKALRVVLAWLAVLQGCSEMTAWLQALRLVGCRAGA